jgi:hypothetical protein
MGRVGPAVGLRLLSQTVAGWDRNAMEIISVSLKRMLTTPPKPYVKQEKKKPGK